MYFHALSTTIDAYRFSAIPDFNVVLKNDDYLFAMH